jgi:hypothetical protein
MSTSTSRPDSRIARLAEEIRLAVEFLVGEGYTLNALANETGLHKNSIMRVPDMRVAWAVMKKQRKSRHLRLVEADESDRGSNRKPATLEWLWNPQCDTIERLEKLIEVARARGYAGGSAGTGRRKRASTNGASDTAVGVH